VEDLGKIAGARALPWTSVPLRQDTRPVADQLQEFEAVYEECLPIVLRYMLARVQDPVLAEDLTGDVFERAVRAWPSFEHRSSPSTWVLSIAHHVVSHHWRKARTQPVPIAEVSIERADTNAITLQEQVERRDQAEQIRRVVAHLPLKEQELLALRFAAELSYRDIAAVLNVREVTVRVRLHRAIRRLECMLPAVEQ
jgi:RNA polymerase sigma-70 factor (ECF subfamily)